MKYTNGATIKTLISEDGCRCVDLVARYDGLFQWHEHRCFDGDEYSGPHWESGWMSGLYANEELAEQGAMAELPWLHGRLSN